MCTLLWMAVGFWDIFTIVWQYCSTYLHKCNRHNAVSFCRLGMKSFFKSWMRTHTPLTFHSYLKPATSPQVPKMYKEVQNLGLFSTDLDVTQLIFHHTPLKRTVCNLAYEKGHYVSITLSGRPVMFFFMFWAILTVNGSILLIKTHFLYFPATQDQQKPSLM